MERLLKIAEVERLTSLNRSDIYKRIKNDEFPKNVKTSIRAVAWIESEIEKWIQERIAQSRGE